MRTMDIRSMAGNKVKFAYPGNGYEQDQELACENLMAGNVYTIKKILVGDAKTWIELEGFPGLKFNSVLFADA